MRKRIQQSLLVALVFGPALGLGLAGVVATASARPRAPYTEETYELHVWVRGSADDATGTYTDEVVHVNEELVPGNQVAVRLLALEHGYQVGATYFPPTSVLLGRAVPYRGHGR